MLENRGERERAAVPNIFSPGWQILWFLVCGIGGCRPPPTLWPSLSQEDLLSSRSFQDFDPFLPSKRILSGRKSREKNHVDTSWTLEEIEKNRQTGKKKIIAARRRVDIGGKRTQEMDTSVRRDRTPNMEENRERRQQLL